MEWGWLVTSLPLLVAIVAGAGAMAWQLKQLQNFVKEQAIQSREDRRLMHDKIDAQRTEFAT